jgi:hypothetical protein
MGTPLPVDVAPCSPTAGGAMTVWVEDGVGGIVGCAVLPVLAATLGSLTGSTLGEVNPKKLFMLALLRA